MAPGARVAAAIECLDQILNGHAAERALTNWARASRFAGSKDRAAVRDHVFGALRGRNSHAALGGAMTGRGLMIGALRAAGQDLDALFNDVGHAPAELTAAERDLRPETIPSDLPQAMREALPADMTEADIAALDDLYRRRAPICVRVRQAAMGTAQAQDALMQAGIETHVVPDVPTALIVTKGERQIRNHQLYLSGALELQDTGAQALCLELPVHDGDRVLDFCAGGGGKILALADRAQIVGFAHDVDRKRMADLPARAERAAQRIQLVDPGAVKGSFDLVLADVPCTGSGTWRRAPDAKWRFTCEGLDAVAQIQAQILNDVVDHVRPGGVLAYATCSVFPAENHDQIARFMKQHPYFEPVHASLRWPDETGDGFFVSVLRRSE